MGMQLHAQRPAEVSPPDMGESQVYVKMGDRRDALLGGSAEQKVRPREVRAPEAPLNPCSMCMLQDCGFDPETCHVCIVRTETGWLATPHHTSEDSTSTTTGATGAEPDSTAAAFMGVEVVESTAEELLSESAEPLTPMEGGTALDEAPTVSSALGSLLTAQNSGHARFLQHFFRRSRAIRPGCWSAGGMAGLVLFRPVKSPTCGHGMNLAPESVFEAQRARWLRGKSWLKQHALLLKRFQSGLSPMVLDLFCCAGGVSAGAIQVGASSVGVDSSPQPNFCARFGNEVFVLGDATDMDRLRGLVRKYDPFLIWASPPCQPYTTATNLGAPSTSDRLISLTREVLTMLGKPWVIENVVGARSSMREPFLLHGAIFGLHCDRARLFETGGGFSLRREVGLFSSGCDLRDCMCLGRRRRFPRNDFFGRRVEPGGPWVCCDGNSWATQGTSPSAGTLADHAASMGIDPGHMTYLELAQAIPPDYASFIVGQAVQHALRSRYGVDVITLDALDADRGAAQAQMRLHLLRGAGGVSPTSGMGFVAATPKNTGGQLEASFRSLMAGLEARGERRHPQRMAWLQALDRARQGAPLEGDEVLLSLLTSQGSWSDAELDQGRPEPVGDDAGVAPTEGWRPRGCQSVQQWSLGESDFRELDYTHAGSYDRVFILGQAPNWSARLRSCRRREPLAWTLDDPSVTDPSTWRGQNTFVHMPGIQVASRLARLTADFPAGSRVTAIVSDATEVGILVDAGFRRVAAWPTGFGVVGSEGEEQRLLEPAVALSFGRRECVPGEGFHLDHSKVEPFMDPRDRGSPSCGKGAKAALAWSWLSRHPERWVGAGFSPEIERMMTVGVEIDTIGDDKDSSQEISQYKFKDAEHFVRGSQECDRALICGHLEIVPANEVEWALANGSVHPWTVVHQSADKWRSCQDYKSGTNSRVISSPFTLCSALEVAAVMKPDSHFAKFDLRDGFWSVPVATDSRHHLMVRHPATGQLLRCTSLPFGFAKSPQHFCAVTEAVAQRLRQRLAAAGIEGVHAYVFVDDFLLVGDTKELTRIGMRMFAALLGELGLPFAPHKTRGPARVMEFLGFLLSNVEGSRCISLTSGRQAKMIKLIEEWQQLEPSEGEVAARADPKELANVLGLLVFASTVVPNSRVYMQAMLRQFAGLEVDWARGMVRHVDSAWTKVTLTGGFWRDLHWWRSALLGPNCVAFDQPSVGEIAIVGTDASDLACGELIWLDGAREETQLLFTHAERRRPINFRELRGTLRALELWGHRLRGRLVLIETDNTFGHEGASKMRCKAEDGQELIRRIHALAAKHSFFIRSVHTPGVMLVRPDQTSRGAAPEEPRLRLTRGAFHLLERRFGPFDEYLGAERELAGTAAPARPFKRLWAHPSFDTVGSALRIICERLTTDSARCPRGVVVVPYAPEAAWWKLTRHFACVGRWGTGELGLEAAVAGEWLPSSTHRPTLLLAFPRAGAMLMPLGEAVHLGSDKVRPGLYKHEAIDVLKSAWVNADSSLPVGTLLYVPRRLTSVEVAAEARGASGVLYMTHEVFDGTGNVICVELRRLGAGNRHHYSFDRGSFAAGGRPWSIAPNTAWVVNHLGGRLRQQPATAARDRETARYIFDFDRAEADIARLRVAMAGAAHPWVGVLELGEGIEEVAAGDASPEPSTPGLAEGGEEADEGVAMSGYAAQRLAPQRALSARHHRRTPAEDEQEAEGSEIGEAVRALSPAEGTASRRVRAVEHARRKPVPAPAAGITEPTRCQYAAMHCRGCDEEVGLDVWTIPGGLGMVHNTAACHSAACIRRDEEAAQLEVAEELRRRREENPGLGPLAPPADAEEEQGPTAPANMDELRPSIEHTPFSSDLTVKPSRADRNQRVVQMDESLSVARRAMVRACLEGKCEHAGSAEPTMTCVGSCHRQLHGIKCAQLSNGQAILAVFKCAECRLGEVILSDPPYTEAALKTFEETMLQEMSSGAEQTGAGFADFAKLEAEWALAMGGGKPVRLPSDDPTALKAFLTWLVRDKERARSLGSLWRVIGLYMIKSGRPNLTYLDSSVKAHYSSLVETHGVEEHPRTAATPRMIDWAINKGVVEKHCPKPFICKRTKLDIGLEVGCGVRVGEAMGAGDYHGVKADHVAILRNTSTGLVTVEMMLEHSKTKFKRWTNCLGTTLGAAHLPLAQLLRSYWEACGQKPVTFSEGGYEVTTVDYSVARVSMLGMSTATLDKVEALLQRSEVTAVRKAAKATMYRARKRKEATTSKDKRYINVHGGPKMSAGIAQLALEFERGGLGMFLSIVEGPLLRSTDGDTISHMPLDPSSTYGTLHAVMDEAYMRANPPGDPDPWLDLQGLDDPLWGHHSFRRCADTVARSTMAKSGVSEQDIDRVFGWLEAMYSHRMQYHYETRFNRDRRYRVTMYL
jgi:hypothetical protein